MLETQPEVKLLVAQSGHVSLQLLALVESVAAELTLVLALTEVDDDMLCFVMSTGTLPQIWHI